MQTNSLIGRLKFTAHVPKQLLSICQFYLWRTIKSRGVEWAVSVGEILPQVDRSHATTKAAIGRADRRPEARGRGLGSTVGRYIDWGTGRR